MMEKTETLFAVSVVSSVNTDLAKNLERKGSILIIQLLRANGRLLLALSTHRMSYPSRK